MKKLFLILIVTSIFQNCMFVSNAHAQVNTQDSLALVALYNSTNGSNWTCGCNQNWLQTPVSQWYGVTVENNRVTYLQLNSGVGACGSCNLTGTIPPEIGLLTGLNFLWLSNNTNLTGTIPPEIGNLNSLYILSFDYCSLNGSIPVQIGNLNSLERLYIRYNQLSGQIPVEIGNLTNLKQINLQNNYLTGSIPLEIGNLINLEYLFLRKNNLSGSIPLEIGNLTSNFSILVLDSNQFFGKIPDEIINLQNIQWIKLNNNQFTSIPNLTSLTHLTSVKLENNQLTFEDLEPNAIIVSNVYTYSPQDSVNNNLDTSLEIHAIINLKTSVSGTFNQYQWFLNGNIISGATDSIYTISDFQATDTGKYTCSITNTLVTGLTLWRKYIYAKLGPVGIDKITTTNQYNLWVQKNILYIEFNKELAELLRIGVYMIDGRVIGNYFLQQGIKDAEIALPPDIANIFIVKLHSKQTNISRLITNVK